MQELSRIDFLVQTFCFYIHTIVINKLRGTFTKYGSFTGSVIRKKRSPVMLGHDDDETWHNSYELFWGLNILHIHFDGVIFVTRFVFFSRKQLSQSGLLVVTQR